MLNTASLVFAVPNPLLHKVSLGRPAFQVSNDTDSFGTHAASLANDGSRRTDYEVFENGCAGSEPANNPWWAVDLGVSTVVCLVKLTNRGDANSKCSGTWTLFSSRYTSVLICID